MHGQQNIKIYVQLYMVEVSTGCTVLRNILRIGIVVSALFLRPQKVQEHFYELD